MNKAAELAYNTLMVSDNQESLSVSYANQGTKPYDYLNYHEYENKLDELFKSKEKNKRAKGNE